MRSSGQTRKQEPRWQAAAGGGGRSSDDEILGSYVHDQTRYAREQKEALWIGMSVLAALSAVVASMGVAGLVAGVLG